MWSSEGISSLCLSGLSACFVKSFSKPALFNKLLFELSQLLIQQIVGLMYQADNRIGGHFRRAL